MSESKKRKVGGNEDEAACDGGMPAGGRDELIKRLKAKDQERDELIKRLEAKDQERDELIKRLEARDQERDDREKAKGLGGLLEAKEANFKLIRVGNLTSHVHGNHLDASAEEIPVKDDCPVPINPLVASKLVGEFTDQDVETNELKWKEYRFGSEADICALLRAGVQDAIKLLRMEKKYKEWGLHPRMERSLFSCRPDVMVVRDSNDVALLAIEGKLPVSDLKGAEQGLSLVSYPAVLGHGYDHAQALDAFGQGTPLVIITSFEESYLCSLTKEHLESPEEGQAVAQSPPRKPEQKAVKESPSEQRGLIASQSPRTMKSPPAKTGPSDIPYCVSYSDSSPSSGSESGTKLDEALYFTERVAERKFYRSQAFGPHEFVKLAYIALKIAIDAFKKESNKIHKLVDGKTYCFPRALRVANNMKTYCWGTLRVEVGKLIQSRRESNMPAVRPVPVDSNDEDAFYIIGCLGRGATSNVYHALDAKGRQVALKMYVKDTVDNVRLENAEFRKNAKKATETEVEMLRTFYSFMADEIAVVELVDKQCVKMPLFEPVAKQERGECLTNIQEVLSNVFEKNGKKYQYEDVSDDVRWRHVGIYRKGNEKKCILYDLADLVVVKEDDTFVQDHYMAFENRMGFEAEPEATILNCKATPKS